jgi:hypothetical protein
LKFSRLAYDGILAPAGTAIRVWTGKQAGRLGPRPGTAEAGIMTRAAPEPPAEVWTYGGVRVGQGGKRARLA